MADFPVMLRPRRTWTIPPRAPVASELVSAAERHAVSPRLLQVLVARGIDSPDALAGFLGDPLAGLHDPALLPDARAFRERLAAARDRGERVMVYGDFDADGLTGLAVMVLALRAFGLDVEPYAPTRFLDGHGLSLPAIERARETGCRLIVTVDCGTSSADEVAIAAEREIDVLVTDHHHVPERVPAALALVNPYRADSAYPDPRLTGAGIAFRLAQLLLADAAGGDEVWLGLSDLATVGTIADVAPLVGENRAIVRLGLERIRRGSRPGLASLVRAAGLAADRLDADAISFALAPRLNAAGRVGDVTLASALLLTSDPAEADALADRLEETNRARRDLTATAVAEAKAVVGDPGDAPAVVVVGSWPVGLIGLIAGKLAESLRRPAVVFSTSVEPWRGSARAPAGTLDLAATFAACARHFVRFGGHPEAAGCDLVPGSIDAFRGDFLAHAAAAPRRPGEGPLAVDIAIPVAEVDYELLHELRRLEPAGVGNPAPLVAVLGARVTRVRAASNGHCQLTVSKGREVLDVIAFGRGDLADAVAADDVVDIVGRLASRRFGGFESLQLELVDAATAGFRPEHGEWIVAAEERRVPGADALVAGEAAR